MKVFYNERYFWKENIFFLKILVRFFVMLKYTYFSLKSSAASLALSICRMILALSIVALMIWNAHNVQGIILWPNGIATQYSYLHICNPKYDYNIKYNLLDSCILNYENM